MDRIVNGLTAPSGQFPWFARVYFSINWCGATLITWKHLLSAAHCMYHPTT
ncbi:transmembrane protease serine 5-like [Tropilaelaps mercedesae]|uniref:Transmembrane protease serine 5-like n=1 Tax=Tropilaelaps mercedesae TaxID=418985 RepID=A0A1V9XJL9_9ACAR|nr:transmembrane protease serine 5-like [Tropilaelaps mercedesae]